MVKLNIGAIPQILEINPGARCTRCTKACANKELRPTCEESGGAILDLVVSENGVILIRFIQKYGYGSMPINAIFRGMNIHLPAILMFTRGTRFWHTAIWVLYIIINHQGIKPYIYTP